ncbi:MAG: Queuosine precursor transporter QueT [candidate division WS2 bacterium]|uniref:Queuosine transporter QueT n=1 Tax=Psychracetigena formicireducens TaxID=2986056 RepID=A0A9E2F1J3_PSYF1|nr:Queuosine precursor transporter QueT [Candidatus Psychracetigena formicireducens]MBT9145499.1 Queuosine precursor transporter QueT [Candidatus Psychracetigena formicireducens]
MLEKDTRKIVFLSIIGATYAAITVLLIPISYGPFQLRLSEALTVLPYLFPQAVYGLFIGCFIANLFSPFGLLDIIFGSIATLIAAYLTSKAPNIYLAPLPPVVINAFIIPIYLSNLTGIPYWLMVSYIGLSQTVVCYGIGLPLLIILKKRFK